VTETPCGQEGLLAWFGEVDVYLFDQLLRGRITPDMRILDAGCGHGRNLHHLLRCGADVHGVDRDPGAVEEMRRLAEELAPELPRDRFQAAEVAHLPYDDATFDAVLSSAVLHFADDEDHFEAMLLEMWRVLRPGGVLFARLASSIGLESRIRHLEGRRFALPDGTERFLVDAPYLQGLQELLGAEPLDPLKTTLVEDRRAMTTWVLRRRGRPTPSPRAAAARRRATAPMGVLLDRIRSLVYRLGPRPPGVDEGGAEDDPAEGRDGQGESPAEGRTGGPGGSAPGGMPRDAGRERPRGSGPPDWERDDEEALVTAAAGYGEHARELAGELAAALARLRTAGADGSGEASWPAELDRAKRALSGLETVVLVEDALHGDG
jgi:SAM-dependent methyltransferase